MDYCRYHRYNLRKEAVLCQSKQLLGIKLCCRIASGKYLRRKSFIRFSFDHTNNVYVNGISSRKKNWSSNLSYERTVNLWTKKMSILPITCKSNLRMSASYIWRIEWADRTIPPLTWCHSAHRNTTSYSGNVDDISTSSKHLINKQSSATYRKSTRYLLLFGH